jgi:hypothetical protein
MMGLPWAPSFFSLDRYNLLQIDTSWKSIIRRTALLYYHTIEAPDAAIANEHFI